MYIMMMYTGLIEDVLSYYYVVDALLLESFNSGYLSFLING